VRRVLRDDGTLWLNLGDSYAAQRGGTHQPAETLAGGVGGKMGDGATVNRDRHAGYNPTRFASRIGLKHKDLIGVPWRVAFALQADGWYLRQDIIWAKPNPMPESVTDRCTKSHEYVFLLSKAPRYYFDADAIAEPAAGLPRDQVAARKARANGEQKMTPTDLHNGIRRSGNKERKPGSARGCPEGNGSNVCGSVPWEGSTRNKRSVWTVPTTPFREAHFATFPEALIEPCILAGSRNGDTVLDPFMGAGTTAVVCERLSRRWIGCELNPDYAAIAERRIRATQPGLALGAA
jgi:DNA modification methylase